MFSIIFKKHKTFWSFSKFFATINTFISFFSHLSPIKLKAAFRLLTKARLSAFTLLTAYFKHKNTALSLATIIIAFLLFLSNSYSQEWDTHRLSTMRDAYIDQTTLADEDILAYDSTLYRWENVTFGSLGNPLYVNVTGDTMTGDLIFDGATLLDQTGTLTIGGTGGTNNENLTFNFETTADAVTLGSGTGVGVINWGGDLYFSAGASEISFSGAKAKQLFFGGSRSGTSFANETAALGNKYTQLVISLYDNLIICERGDTETSWGHTSAGTPRLYIQSSDATSVSDYLEFYHDQTDGNINIGAGDLKITAAGGDVNFNDENLTTTGTGSFGKLIFTDTSASFEDITFAENAFSLQCTDANPLDFNLMAAINQNAQFTLYADGAAGDWGNYLTWFASTHDAGTPQIYIGATGPLDILCGDTYGTSVGDNDDYIQFRTSSDVPEITTVGACDLKISSSANIQINADVETDRWLNSDTNVFLGVDVVGSGNLAHATGREGWYNVAIGNYAMFDAEDSHDNVAIGYGSMANIISGSNNAGLGTFTLNSLTSGDSNMAVGPNALYSVSENGGNVGIGDTAGQYVTGNNGCYIGFQAGRYLGDSDNNVAIGNSSMHGNAGTKPRADYNVGIGIGSVGCRISGSTVLGNVGIGAYALWDVADNGNYNTAAGYYAGTNVTTGDYGIFLGHKAGESTTTGSRCIIIGNDIDASAADADDELNIGGLLKGDMASDDLWVVGDFAVSDDSPHATWRDSTDNVAFQWHLDTADSTWGIYQLWKGTDTDGKSFNVGTSPDNVPIMYVEADGDVFFREPIRGITSLWWYCKYIHPEAFSTGASGTTQVLPDVEAGSIGGWRLDRDVVNEKLYMGASVCSNWDAASDIEIRVSFEVGAAGAIANDTIDLLLDVYFKGDGESAVKEQNLSKSTTINAAAQYTMFVATFLLDYDDAGDPVEVGDKLGMRLHLDTANSEVDDAIINHVNFRYKTKQVHIKT